MPNLRRALATVLGEIGVLEHVTLGTSQKQQVSPADKEKIERVLAEQQTFNSTVLALAISMLVVIFLAGVFLAIYHINRPAFAAAAIGGNLLSLLLTVSWMRRLWVEKGIVDLARLAVQEFPPDEGIKLACSLYFGLLAAKTKTQLKAPSKKTAQKTAL